MFAGKKLTEYRKILTNRICATIYEPDTRTTGRENPWNRAFFDTCHTNIISGQEEKRMSEMATNKTAENWDQY
jgi:hypothetical protein